jgi:hypothetical protein
MLFSFSETRRHRSWNSEREVPTLPGPTDEVIE